MTKTDFQDFAANYYKRFAAAVLDFDQGPLAEVLSIFDRVRAAGGTIWIAGNGGSGSMADHAVCDCSKGTYVEGAQPLRTISLTANMPLLTALGNDISYDDVYSEPLKYYLRDTDALLLISSSGNSGNVVNACEYAQAQGVPTMAFVGFKGGRLKEIADTVVHVDIDNYGIVEDIHMSLIHVLTQYIQAQNAAAVSG